MRQLLIRADASPSIGVGHFMRMLALAQAWIARGGGVLMAAKGAGASLADRAGRSGAGYLPLAEHHPHPSDLGTTLGTLERMARSDADALPWLCLDGYHFSPEYQAAIRAAGYPLLVVDDYAHLPRYHASILLNQNISAAGLAYSCDPDTRLLLGTHYALLRGEIAGARPEARPSPEVARRILVTMGGADPHDVTGLMMRALSGPELAESEVVAVVGSRNPHRDALLHAAEPVSHLRVEVDVTDMSELMGWAELAISGGGSTVWELAHFGVPMQLVVYADNQRAIATGMARAGAAEELGWYADLREDEVARRVLALARDRPRRERMSDLGPMVVDGRGAARVVDAMLEGR